MRIHAVMGVYRNFSKMDPKSYFARNQGGFRVIYHDTNFTSTYSYFDGYLCSLEAHNSIMEWYEGNFFCAFLSAFLGVVHQ